MFTFIIIYFPENDIWHFIADNSHEMSNFIFSEKLQNQF